MQKRVADANPPLAPLAIGEKRLPSRAGWSPRILNEIELALLRNAAFGRTCGTAEPVEFLFVDPNADGTDLLGEDRLARLTTLTETLGIGMSALAHRRHPRFGNGGFTDSVADLAASDGDELCDRLTALAAWYEAIVRAAARERCVQIVLPAACLASALVLTQRLGKLPAQERPFVHLILARRAFASLPPRLGDLAGIGRAFDEVNAQGPSLFVYTWGAAQREVARLRHPVIELDVPTALDAASLSPPTGETFSVGVFGAGPTRALCDVMAMVEADSHGEPVRWLVNSPLGQGGRFTTATPTRLSFTPQHITVIDEVLTRPLLLAAIGEVDAVVLPSPSAPGAALAQRIVGDLALAAGRLVLTPGNGRTGAKGSGWEEAARVLMEAARRSRRVRADTLHRRRRALRDHRPARCLAQLLYQPSIAAARR